jgi:hypothetical protein
VNVLYLSREIETRFALVFVYFLNYRLIRLSAGLVVALSTYPLDPGKIRAGTSPAPGRVRERFHFFPNS